MNNPISWQYLREDMVLKTMSKIHITLKLGISAYVNQQILAQILTFNMLHEQECCKYMIENISKDCKINTM